MTVDRKVINDLDFQNAQKVKNAVDGVDPQDYATVNQLGGFVPDPSGEPDDMWLKTASGALIYTAAPGGASFATPAIVLGSSAAAGSAGTVIRSDGTIAAFDATTPASQAFGDAGTVGSAAFAARRDHKHPMMANPLTETGGPTVLAFGAVANGEYLTRSGSSIIGGSPTPGGPPTGAAGGDLAGTYPNPTVARPAAKRYLSKPAGNITRAATSVGAFSTAWQIPSVVVASGQNVALRVVAARSNGGITQDHNLTIKRGSTVVASATYTIASSMAVGMSVLEWIDEAPTPGTYTYEVQAAQFVSGTLTVFQTLPSTDTAGGSSIFIAEVYTP